jgi:hypothetical protein
MQALISDTEQFNIMKDYKNLGAFPAQDHLAAPCRKPGFAGVPSYTKRGVCVANSRSKSATPLGAICDRPSNPLRSQHPSGVSLPPQ